MPNFLLKQIYSELKLFQVNNFMQICGPKGSITVVMACSPLA